ncbi:unnamed protein product, partial [Symbiodinium pilosum]
MPSPSGSASARSLTSSVRSQTEDEPLVRPSTTQGLHDAPHHVRIPFSVKLVAVFATFLGVGFVFGGRLGWLRDRSIAPAERVAPKEVVSEAEVDSAHIVPGYTEFAHVN